MYLIISDTFLCLLGFFNMLVLSYLMKKYHNYEHRLIKRQLHLYMVCLVLATVILFMNNLL